VKKLLANPIKPLNYICAVLLVLLLITQFLPFYACNCTKGCEGDGTISLSEYIWFPEDHEKGITKQIQSSYDKEFELNDIVITPVAILVAGVVGIFMCSVNAHKSWVSIFPVIAGVAGVFGYMSSPVLQMGNNWMLHWVASLVVLIVGAISFVISTIKYIQNKLEEWRNTPI